MRIVFFSSGDFAIPTFKSLIEENAHKIVGLVTSKDKVVFNDKRLFDIAKENGIPTYIPNDLESDDFINWLKECNAEVFCVISYKKLPKKVLDVVRGNAFNVHASYLPFLRGAAPINWALRLGFKETGLTSFILDNKIDCGDIITQCVIDIRENDNYGTLFERMSQACVGITFETLTMVGYGGRSLLGLTFRPQVDIGVKSELLNAPKINKEYFKCDGKCSLERMIRSVTPIDGMPCKFVCFKVHYDSDAAFYPKFFNAKIYDGYTTHGSPNDVTDGKTYLNVVDMSDTTYKTVFSVTEIQLEGKKRMSIRDFLNGFKYYHDPEYFVQTYVGEQQKNVYIDV